MINLFIPGIVIFIIIYGLYKGVDIFDSFIKGVKEGIVMCYNLFPTLFSLVFAISIFTGSGIVSDISDLLNNIFTHCFFPFEVLPLALLRPISGSGSLAILNDLLNTYGPDTFIGRVSSVMMGSTDTTIYIIGLYFSSIGIKKIRYSLLVGLLADLISIIMSVVVVSLLFK